jgi:hypothetical protein
MAGRYTAVIVSRQTVHGESYTDTINNLGTKMLNSPSHAAASSALRIDTSRSNFFEYHSKNTIEAQKLSKQEWRS